MMGSLAAVDGDDDVGRRHVVEQRLVPHRLAAEAFGQLDGPLEGPVGDQDTGDAVALEVGHHQFGHLASPDDQHHPVAQLAEHVAREIDRHRGDRERALADAGLGAHPFAHFERATQQAVEHRAGGPGLLGDAVGVLELVQYLRLAQHHGIEGTRHREEVPHRLSVLEVVDAVLEVGATGGGGVAQRFDRHLLQREARSGQVELRAVARAHGDGLVHGRRRHQVAHQPLRPVVGESHLLPDFDAGRLMVDAQDCDLHGDGNAAG